MVRIIVIITPAPWRDLVILAIVQAITLVDTRKMEHENKRNRQDKQSGIVQIEAVYNFRRSAYSKYNICRWFSQSLLNYS